MAIKGLTDRNAEFPQLGSIRKGAAKTANAPGADLRYFRVVFDEQETDSAAAFHAAYKGAPVELNIRFPFNEIERNFDTWLEGYTAGALVYRSDGERVLYEIDPATGEKLVINGEPNKPHRANPIGHYINQKGKREPINAKATGRLKVIIPELARLAYLTVHTTSVHDVINLSRQLQALLDIHGRLAGIPLKLRRRPVKVSTPSGGNGKRARREKWLLSVEADPEWVRAKLAEMDRLALPEGYAPLGLPAPVIENVRATAAPYASTDDDDAEEGEYEDAGDETGEPATTPHAGNGNGDAEASKADPATSGKRVAEVTCTGTRFAELCRELAAAHPRYQIHKSGQPTGAPNTPNILAAALKCGYGEVNNDNVDVVFEAIAQRAAEKAEA